MRILKTKVKLKPHHLKPVLCALVFSLTVYVCKTPIKNSLTDLFEFFTLSSAAFNMPVGTMYLSKETVSEISSAPTVSTPDPAPEKEDDIIISAPVLTEPEIENRGDIESVTYTAQMSKNIILHGNGYIKNETNNPTSAVQKILTKLPDITLDDSGPQVLIMHTHTTESYEPYSRPFFDKDAPTRTTDLNYNMARVGEVITNILSENGISVLHDTTLHDYPSYNGSYDRSRETVKEYLKKYPSIKVVLDVHRDAIERQDGTRVKAVAEISGKNAAQIMIISGCDDGSMNMPNWRENLRFSAMLQNALETDYPNLMRPLYFCYRKYNQDLTTGSILVEFGTHANSLDEAIYSAELFSKTLVKVLKQ